MVSLNLQSLVALSLAITAISTPQFYSKRSITHRAAPDNTVRINSADDYCMIMPRTSHTNIGDSEHPGGMQTYCSASARKDDSQGLLPDGFWSEVEHEDGKGGEGGRYVQLTGCINPDSLDRLNPQDEGGQYDSSGGRGKRGNPAGSACEGYNHYVELVEPSARRACIRCCDEFDDCPVKKDTDGCPKVIPGNYFNCG